MKEHLKVLALSLSIVFLFINHGYADSPHAGNLSETPYVQDELLVKFRPGVPGSAKSDAHARAGAFVITEFPSLRLQHVKLRNGQSVEAAIAVYEKNPNVEYAEPNYIVSADAFPSDPQFNDLWGLHNTGQSGGTPDADIDAPEAWDITTGLINTVVAIIDTGIDYNHEDLAPNVWVNPAEYNGAPGFDDDGNGYADDIYGIDTCNNDTDPFDDHSHGTHVAGTIGALGDNATGVAGVNWDIQFVACKFLCSNNYGSISDAVECMQYVKGLKDNGVDIIATNNSWGGGGYSQAFKDAIDAQRDILFVAAAGNDYTDNDLLPHYPASYALPNVIAVTATDRNDNRVYNYGRRSVHLGAPGYFVLSTTPGNAYQYMSGTSMATPHVTGAIALLRAQEPGRDWRALKNLLLSGGDAIPSLEGKTVTGRRLNALGALTCADSPVFSALQYPPADGAGLPATLSALSINCDTPVGPVTVTDPYGAVIDLYDDGIDPDQAAGDGIFSGIWNSLADRGWITFSSPAGSESLVPFFRVVTSTLPEANTHAFYHITLQADGGTEPYTWALAPGSSLPDGLSLNSSTGEISGVPSTEGLSAFTVEVTDAEASIAEKTLIITIVNDFVIEEWVESYDSGANEITYDVAVAGNGDLYVAGYQDNGADSDFLLMKYDTAGSLLWSRTYDAGADETATSLALDSNGNVYMTGDTDDGTGNADYLTVSYDSSGNLLWARVHDGGGKDKANGIVVDEGATPPSLYVSGYSLVAGAYSDVLTVKYDLAGNLLWARKTRPVQFTYAYDLALDGAGNFYVVGDGFVQKCDADGNVLWTSTFTGASRGGIAVDDGGNVYVAATLNSGFFTQKYDSSGNLLWSRTFHESKTEMPYALALDQYGYIYVTGYTTSNGVSSDLLTVKYDPSGSLLWTKQSDYGNSEISYGIAVEGKNILLTGRNSSSGYDSLLVKYTMAFDIINWSLPKALIDQPYSTTVLSDGGVPPYTWSVVAGLLPEGLVLNASTGEVSGTPAMLGVYVFTIQAQDTLGATAAREFTIAVEQEVSSEWFTTYGGSGYDYGHDVAVDNGGYVYLTGTYANTTDNDCMTVKYDPDGNVVWERFHDGGDADTCSGVAVDTAGNIYVAGTTYSAANSNDWIIIKYDPSGTVLWQQYYSNSGTDQATDVAVDGSGYIYVTGCNSYGDIITIKYDQDGNEIWTAVYESGPVVIWGKGVAVDASGNVYVSGYNNNGVDHDFLVIKYDSAGTELWSVSYDGGYYDDAEGVAVDAAGNVYAVGHLAQSISQYQIYLVKLDPMGNEIWNRIIDGGYGEGIKIDKDGFVYVTGTVAGIGIYTVKYSPAGDVIWTAEFPSSTSEDIALGKNGNVYAVGYQRDSLGYFDALLVKYWQRYPLEVSTSSLPDANINTAYSQTLKVFGGKPAYSWAIVSGTLPPGIVLDSLAGIISGTPSATGTYAFTVEVTDSESSTAQKPLSITVHELAIAASVLPYGVTERAYSETLQATGGIEPYAWAITAGALPGGLSLNSSTGVISGTPTTEGASSFTVQVTDADASTASKDFTIAVYEPLAVATPALSHGITGRPYSETLAATGGLPPCTWAITSGTLPDGLSLSGGTGLISGTPTVVGTFGFSVQATDANGETDERALSISVYEPLAVSTLSLSYGVTGRAYSQSLSASGGLAPYTWAVFSGTLPGGLTLDTASGSITGTPTSAGASFFTVRVSDAIAETADKDFSIAVYEPVSITTSSLPAGEVGVPYSQTLDITGGLAPYSWTIVNSALPDGLGLDSATGVISGAPTVSGVYDFTAGVTDANAEVDQKDLSISVGVTTTYSILSASGCSQTTYTRGPVYAVLGTSGSDCPSEDTIQWKFKGDPRDMLVGYLANGGYSTDVLVSGASTDVDLSFLIQGGVGTGYARLVEVDPADGSVIQALSSVSIALTAGTTAHITDISSLSGTVSSGNTLGIVLSLENSDRADNIIKWGKAGGGAGLEQWFTVTETPIGSTTPPANNPPTAAANGPYSGMVNLPVAFSSSGSSDPDGDPITYLWDFGDGQTSTEAHPSHIYSAASTYTITLTVTDSWDTSDTDTTTADISGGGGTNQPPVADAGADINAAVRQLITFDGSGSHDPDGTIVMYQWDFGDGKGAEGASVSHDYKKAGTYTVTLTVTDDQGATGQDTAVLTITK